MSFLMRPDPFSSDVNRLFNTLLAPEGARAQRWAPAMDLVEAEDHYVLRADLPGMDENDVSIEIHDNVLTVSGERHDEQEHSRQGWHRVERSFGRFTRSLSLPEGIDPERISASFQKGVLSITVPKPEQRKPRRVQISVGGGASAAEGADHPGAEHGPVEGTATERGAGAQEGERLATEPAATDAPGGDRPTGEGSAADRPAPEGPAPTR